MFVPTTRRGTYTLQINTHTYQSEHRPIHTTKHRHICTNQTETHTYQQILSQNTDIFLQLNINSYVPTKQILTCILRLLYVEKPQNTDIFFKLNINSYVPTQQTHTRTNQNTDIFQQLNIDSYVPTKQRHICTNKTFTLCVPISSATLGAAPIMLKDCADSSRDDC